MPISWPTIQDTIFDAVLAAAQISVPAMTAAQVMWTDQNAPAPYADYIALRFSAMVSRGIDWQENYTDLGRPAGQEIEMRAIGQRELTIGLQAFCSANAEVSGGGLTARTLLSRVQLALTLPSQAYRFGAVGLAMFESGQVVPLDFIQDEKFFSRASLDIGFYLGDDVSEFAGYIDTVNPVDLTHNDTMDI